MMSLGHDLRHLPAQGAVGPDEYVHAEVSALNMARYQAEGTYYVSNPI